MYCTTLSIASMFFRNTSTGGPLYSSLGTVDTGNTLDADDGVFDSQTDFSCYRALVSDARYI